MDLTGRARRQFATELVKHSYEGRANKTADTLLSILERQDDAHNKLALVGYQSLRNLQANGITLAEIAMDLDMNLLDLMAYMTKHPDAVEHAKLDMLACADYKVAEWQREISRKTPKSKEEADNRKVQYSVLQDQCKRMSAEWAQFAQHDQELAARGQTMAINIHLDMSLQDQPVRVKQVSEDMKPAIEGEVTAQPDEEVADFVDVPIEQVKVQI